MKFDFEVTHRAVVKHQAADELSQLSAKSRNNSLLKDDLLLFVIKHTVNANSLNITENSNKRPKHRHYRSDQRQVNKSVPEKNAQRFDTHSSKIFIIFETFSDVNNQLQEEFLLFLNTSI